MNKKDEETKRQYDGEIKVFGQENLFVSSSLCRIV